MNQEKQTIAVIFGGRTPEHDVSIVTGLQALSAIDQSRFTAFPVYIARDGKWYVGEELRARAFFLPEGEALKKLTEVTLDLAPAQNGQGVLRPKKTSLFGAAKPITFDVAFLAVHGLYSEDGSPQGVCEIAGIPYTGMRLMASAICMDKIVTKQLAKAVGIPVLPHIRLDRPAEGYLIPEGELRAQLGDMKFPLCVKPVSLGSSIGVAKVKDVAELAAVLPSIFGYDSAAMVEPFVPNLVEYNVAVSGLFGEVKTSAIERPKTSAELLDFKEKYMAGGSGKSGTKTAGTKTAGAISEGMLSLTRELNPPELDEKREADLRGWSAAMFTALCGTGAPRIDYLCNKETGELWLNEVNACPGSFGYFLWEAAAAPTLFTPFLTALITEALTLHEKKALPADPVPPGARLFKR